MLYSLSCDLSAAATRTEYLSGSSDAEAMIRDFQAAQAVCSLLHTTELT